MEIVVIKGNRDPSQPDALTRAAERWKSARLDWKNEAGVTTRRMVATMGCPVCSKRVAYGRVKAHLGDHLRSKA